MPKLREESRDLQKVHREQQHRLQAAETTKGVHCGDSIKKQQIGSVMFDQAQTRSSVMEENAYQQGVSDDQTYASVRGERARTQLT